MMSLVFYQTLSHGNARAQVGNTSSSSHLLRDIAYPTQWWGGETRADESTDW